ncbi:hypothetical protein ACFE04_026073 [Oxalis oulophora]
MAANGSSTNQDVARTQTPLSSSLLADHDLLARFVTIEIILMEMKLDRTYLPSIKQRSYQVVEIIIAINGIPRRTYVAIVSERVDNVLGDCNLICAPFGGC